MSVSHQPHSRVSRLLLFSSIFFSLFPGLVLSAVVTLSSIEIFTTHEWLKHTPTVYFLCKGENKTVLPDVKKKSVFYDFKGEESWQVPYYIFNLSVWLFINCFYVLVFNFTNWVYKPLTDFSSKKCKRCGFYEKDSIVADDVFDEWELCPSDFTALDGKYVRFKEKEFNATFLCPECLSFSGASISAPPFVNDNAGKGKRKHVAVVVLLSVLVSAILILGVVGAYKYWLKKKREQDQARFLKLFEEGDDIDDELDLGPMI